MAAAPFGGPTLLKLLNLNVRSKTNTRVVDNAPLVRAKMLKKFNEECGVPIEEFGCIVIDEISFIDAVIFGHVDQGFATLLGNSELCGGMPVLLCGDNHQKPGRNSLVPVHGGGSIQGSRKSHCTGIFVFHASWS